MSDEQENKTGLAGFFNKVREIIEAAETPFAKMAIFILPIIAPITPAAMTGLHMYQLFLELFKFKGANILSGILSLIIGLTLEILGYVGAISFIQSLFRWIKTRNDVYVLPTTLNFLAYAFYLLVMYFVNVQLGVYFDVPVVINKIIGLLSFITVPTGLLAANHLSQREEKEDSYDLRQEKRQDSMERYKIKHGASGLNKVNFNDNLKVEKSSLPKDWRTRRPLLSYEQVVEIANLSTDDELQDYADVVGVDPKTAINHRTKANLELLDNYVKENNSFPSEDELRKSHLSAKDLALYVVRNQKSLLENGIVSRENVEKASNLVKG